MFVIPLTNEPNQNFRCTIPVNGNNLPFDFNLSYNTEALYWVISISNAVTGQNLVRNAPLLAGIYPGANILEQFEHLRIGSAVVVKINPDNYDDAPGADNLGTDFTLVWGDNI
jgi:hypothetical protein